MRNRLTFLSWFCINLAISAASFFAWRAGVFAVVYAQDASFMTSVIAVLFIGTAVWLGWQAWRADESSLYLDGKVLKHVPGWMPADASFGHLAERLLPMAGLFGTAFGLSLQAKTLVGGAAAFGPLATSLYCTACGVLAAALIAVMTFNLEAGIRRTGR